jgi:8-oxo-dGTP pyrophosphatase MutT (NUDIX family)
MRWHIHGERVIYDCEWLSLRLTDVEIPEAERFEHHVVRVPQPAAGVVVHDPTRGVLLLWRHRFITDTWGWEIPAGRIEPGETPEQGALRETIEETGWRPERLQPLVRFHPTNGLSDHTFHIFIAQGATHIGDPTDASESERIEWLPIEEVRAVASNGEMTDGLSLTAICYALAFEALR